MSACKTVGEHNRNKEKNKKILLRRKLCPAEENNHRKKKRISYSECNNLRNSNNQKPNGHKSGKQINP